MNFKVDVESSTELPGSQETQAVRGYLLVVCMITLFPLTFGTGWHMD